VDRLINIKVEGLEQAVSKLNRLNSSLRNEAMREGLQDASDYVRKDAHDKCPVKGGASADGYYKSESEPSSQSGAVRRSIKNTVHQSHAEIFTNHIIAKDLEYGTSRETAHPFMRRSADDSQTRKAVGDKFMAAVNKAIAKVVI
jgi:HK97 gp10 family phage protein